MTESVFLGAVVLAAYLIGAIPFGYLVARGKGVDLFKEGSGNIGATNVGRVLGRKFGILVFVLDFAKGALPALLSQLVARASELAIPAETAGVAGGLAAVLGHLFSPYLGFRGGKGVATGAGVVLVLLPLPALVAIVVWVGTVAAFRYISAASLAAALALVAARLVLAWPPVSGDNAILTGFALAVAGLVVIRHRSNIQRLLQGNENRLKENPTMQSLLKIVHVLAMGMWFGMAMFFTFVVAFSLFDTFKEESQKTTDRASWFPPAKMYETKTGLVVGPAEQGSRAAGTAIAPLFDWYYLLQGLCGFLAVTTAWGWSKQFPQQKIHGRRVLILVLALATVVGGWPVEQYVSDLRPERNGKTEAHLQNPTNTELEAEAHQARAAFGMWHGINTLINLGTIILVTVGMGMAAFLPAEKGKDEEAGIEPKAATQEAV
jgi:glycerol-3-phosphate acyltransferase PlsY